MSNAHVALLAVGLRDLVIRDAAWDRIDAGEPNLSEVMLTVAHRLPAPWNAAPLFLYGWAAWRAGRRSPYGRPDRGRPCAGGRPELQRREATSRCGGLRDRPPALSVPSCTVPAGIDHARITTTPEPVPPA